MASSLQHTTASQNALDVPTNEESPYDVEKCAQITARCYPFLSTSTSASRLTLQKSVLTAKEQISRLFIEPFDLPKPPGNKLYRNLRWSVLSVYQRIFSLAIVVNVGTLTYMLIRNHGIDRLTLQTTSSAASVNLTIGVAIRHEHFVNTLFHLSCWSKGRGPLWLRRLSAKVYCYGGLHSGCSTAAVGWYLLFCVIVSAHLHRPPVVDPLVAALAYFILTILLCLLIFALPMIRSRTHNAFESTHRLGGWLILVLLWTQVVLLATITSNNNQRETYCELAYTPNFWCLLIVTLILVYPWLRLRRWDFVVLEKSQHAMRIYFPQRNLPWGSTLKLSRSPLVENHAFAVIPQPLGTQGFTMVISNAGDWTNGLIINTPDHLWLKGAPSLGVIRVAQNFRPVLIVATGSGIGPCLSFFRGCPGHPCSVLWSAPSPLENFGPEVVNEVLQADAKAVIIDTRQAGRPDLLKLTYQMYMYSKSEAVIIISNAKVTKSLVYELETREVPAYGPIFDS